MPRTMERGRVWTSNVAVLGLVTAALVHCTGSVVTCGPGTQQEGNQCVAVVNAQANAGSVERDASVPPPDAAMVDAATPVDAAVAPDANIPRSDGGMQSAVLFLPARAAVTPGMARCLDELKVLHVDGREESITGTVSIQLANATLAQPTQPQDCERDGVTAPGVIGLAAGVTTMAVHVSQGGVDVSGVFPLVVTAYVPRVVALSRVVEVGGQQPFEGPLWEPAFYALETENGAQVPSSTGSTLVRRFLTPVSADPGIVAVERNNNAWELRGISRGITSLTVRYAPPSPLTELVSLPADLRATVGTLEQLVTILWQLPTGRFLTTANSVATGQCFTPLLLGQFGDLGVSYYQVMPNSTFTVVTPTTLANGTSAGTYCTQGRGEALLRGCSGASCLVAGSVVTAPQSLEVQWQGNPNTALVRSVVNSTAVFCPALRMVVRWDNGDTQDVTSSAALSWSPQNAGSVFLRHLRTADGVPSLDGQGNPCFSFLGGLGQGQQVTVDVDASYGGPQVRIPLLLGF